MTVKEMIERHVDRHNGGWYNVIGLYEDGVMIEWGRGNRSWIKFIKCDIRM